MFVLDTDTLTHLLLGQPRVTESMAHANEEVTLTVVTRIEVLQGRFASILKAPDAKKLLLAQQRLLETERDLAKFNILTIDPPACGAFERLRHNRSLNHIGRADLLIAAITLANRATLVTRNQKDFRKVPGLQIENWAD